MLRVEAVFTAADLRTFIDLPNALYRDLPGFEPPLYVDRDMLLNPAKSAFWHGATACYWLAWLGNKAVGRISAQAHSRIPVGVAPGSGMFGCLDAIDDPAVTQALVAVAQSWLRGHGYTSMFGPCSLDMNDEPGLMVAGSDQPPMTLCPWHPPYLAAHFDAAGFTKLKDLHNWKLDLVRAPPADSGGMRRLSERIRGLRIRHPKWRSYASDIRILCDVYNDGWQDHWGFIPLEPVDLNGLDQLMKWLVPREAFKIVELDERPIAVILMVPNLFELTAGLGSKPGIRGWAKLIRRTVGHRFKSGRIIVVGVARHLQGTVIGSALAALLVDELIAGQNKLRGNWVEAGWVLEDNRALIQILERYAFKRIKTFRIYTKDFLV